MVASRSWLFSPERRASCCRKERKQERKKNISIVLYTKRTCSFGVFVPEARKTASMGKFGGAAVLPVYREEEDEDLFETSSSISGDSDDEAQFSDSEEAEAQEDQFAQQPARRMNSDSLYDLSSMKAQLPVKKGLSKYYDGKSQSFACMSEVRCLEDLRKKENPYKKIKSSKSYVALDGNQEACHIPGANSTSIAKKSGSSCANLMARNNTKSMLYRPPPIPVNKSGYHQ